MNIKEKALEIYNQHLSLASVDGKSFRKTVMDQMMKDLNISLSSASTHYNNCKKIVPVIGLGRSSTSEVNKSSVKNKLSIPDSECYSVLELVANGNIFSVGRCQSFLSQGDASEKFDQKVEAWPLSSWVLIKGLGPISGETFKLDFDEKEIKRYTPLAK